MKVKSIYIFFKRAHVYLKPRYIKFIYFITGGKIYGRQYWTLKEMTDFNNDSKQYWENRGKTYIFEKGRQQKSKGKFVLDVRQQYLKENLPSYIKEVDCILEIGCGFGRNLKFFNEVFKSVKLYGIDFSFNMLIKAGSYLDGLRPRLVCANIINLPFLDNSFKVIYTYGTLQYIDSDNIPTAISELIRVCGAYLVIQEYPYMPDFKKYKGWDGTYRHNYIELFNRHSDIVMMHQAEIGDTYTLFIRKKKKDV